MDNKNIGSCRCAACDKELKDNEYVLCDECDTKSTLDEDIDKILDNISKEYIA